MFVHKPIDLGYNDLKSVTKKSGRKYTTPKGDYPSITTILGQKSKAAIMAWRDRIGHEEANRISSQAARRGTAVHTMCEKYVNNDSEYAKDAMPNILFDFNRIKDILDERIGIVYGQELPLYSDHLKVAGRVDCVAEFDGKLSIIDYKTSRKTKKKEWIDGYFMQECFYAIAWEERTGIPITQLVTIISVDDAPAQIFIEHRDDWDKELTKAISEYTSLDHQIS
jgi:genome maintenance exonuclease 1